MRIYVCVILALALSLGLVIPAFGGATVTSTVYQVSEYRYQYSYHVSLYPETGSTIDMGLSQFVVATWNKNLDNYTNWQAPMGWFASLVALGGTEGIQSARHYSPTGEVYQGEILNGPHLLVWTGPSGFGSLDFGFESNGVPWNMGWRADGWETFWVYDPELPPMQSQIGFGSSTDWSAPVNWGAGPVYGPAPEPGALVVLGSGLLALTGAMLRRRR
ncbi:MAG: hypothetical protein Q7T82_01410 [Armatimonadota bacterium]|nr:hypothetical protein [Armatimonadota bacterium]